MRKYPYNDGPPESWLGTVNDYVPDNVAKDEVLSGERHGRHYLEKAGDEVLVYVRRYILHRQRGTTLGFDMSRGLMVDSPFVRERPEWLESALILKAPVVYTVKLEKKTIHQLLNYRVTVVRRPENVEPAKFVETLSELSRPDLDSMGKYLSQDDPWYGCVARPWTVLSVTDLCAALKDMPDPGYSVTNAGRRTIAWNDRNNNVLGGFALVELTRETFL